MNLIFNNPLDIELFFEQDSDRFNWMAPRPYEPMEEDKRSVSRHMNSRGEPLPLYAAFDLPVTETDFDELETFDFDNFVMTH